MEAGGDTNSTGGAGPSHMHARTKVNCDQVYQWWLAEEAKKHNPHYLGGWAERGFHDG
ncbi:hypothetical protein [Streptomyces rimosus]|uniref:hypothetical protein n=1 Tax=Streptomyces rimosus TaxID=1927 RepID=UPI000B0D732A|nr:hypothetical protein [Streptomyces rimosus]